MHSQFCNKNVFLVEFMKVIDLENGRVRELLQDLHLPQHVFTFVAPLQHHLDGTCLTRLLQATAEYNTILAPACKKHNIIGIIKLISVLVALN